MKSILDFCFAHLEFFLRLTAVLQLGLTVFSLLLPRLLHWGTDIARMPLLLREVFEIHSWFIALTLVIWGVLTWHFAPEMAQAPTDLTRWLCACIGLFWGIRAALQWLHYSSSHWRGIPSRTLIHWTLSAGYLAWTSVYALAAFQP